MYFNVLKRLRAYIGFDARKVLFRALFILISIIVLSCGMFVQQNQCTTLRRYKNVRLGSFIMIISVHIMTFY